MFMIQNKKKNLAFFIDKLINKTYIGIINYNRMFSNLVVANFIVFTRWKAKKVRQRKAKKGKSRRKSVGKQENKELEERNKRREASSQ